MKKKILSMLLVTAMAASMLCGCGTGSNDAADESGVADEGDADSESDAADEGDADSESDAADEGDAADGDSAAGLTVNDGVLTMATNAYFPPYEYYEGDEIVGIDADIAKAIADKLGLELKIEDMEFEAIILAVQSGKADIGLAGMTVRPDRQESVNFSDTYATGIQVVIVKEDSDIKSLEDLEGKKIGVQLMTTGDIFACEDFGEDAVEQYNKGADAVMALTQGKVDAVLIDNEPAKNFVANNEGLKILDTEYAVEDYAACLNKENDALLEKINAAIKELKDDGTLQEIMDKYITAD